MSGRTYFSGGFLRVVSRWALQGRHIFPVVFLLVLPAVAVAAGISGRVINKTTGKPAIGDTVVLIDVSADMEEAGRTRTDASGQFQFHSAREGVPWRIRVTHAGIDYETTAPSQDQPLEIAVFDKASATAGIHSGVQLMRLETESGYLRITEMFTLVNASTPSRTIQKEGLFSLPLPPGAALLSSMAEAPGESVVKSIAVVPPKEDRCYFNFPLRPGTTKIQLQYQVPYSGSFSLTPYIPFPAETFGVILPASMRFDFSDLTTYVRQSVEEGTLELMRGVPPGSAPTFTVSGTGSAIAEESAPQHNLGPSSPGNEDITRTTVHPLAASAKRMSQLFGVISLMLAVFACSGILLHRRSRKLQIAAYSDKHKSGLAMSFRQPR